MHTQSFKTKLRTSTIPELDNLFKDNKLRSFGIIDIVGLEDYFDIWIEQKFIQYIKNHNKENPKYFYIILEKDSQRKSIELQITKTDSLVYERISDIDPDISLVVVSSDLINKNIAVQDSSAEGRDVLRINLQASEFLINPY